MLDKRRILHKNDDVMLCRENSIESIGKWTILDVIGKGGNSICYFATDGFKLGILKEFNPISGLTGKKEILDFVAPYELIDRIKRETPSLKTINNYISNYEVLYSINDNQDIAGAYIWTPDTKPGCVFDEYLYKKQNESGADCSKKLLTIIQSVSSLLDCICILHKVGLLHLDLKPSNFSLKYNGNDEISANNISLFDIDTITMINSNGNNNVGTYGFSAPETEYGKADNRSDIYSVGVILYESIVLWGQENKGLYSSEKYDVIASDVKKSTLITGINKKVKNTVQREITDVLRRSLAENLYDRFECCEDMIAALKRIETQLIYT